MYVVWDFILKNELKYKHEIEYLYYMFVFSK